MKRVNDLKIALLIPVLIIGVSPETYNIASTVITNHDHHLTIQGSKIFGVYRASFTSSYDLEDMVRVEQDFKQLAEAGINTILLGFNPTYMGNKYYAEGKIRYERVLNAAQKFGLQVVTSFGGRSWIKGSIESTTIDRNYILLLRRYLRIIKDHPAVIAVSSFDEPWRPGEPEIVKTLYKIYKEEVPDIPVFVQYGTRDANFVPDSADIAGFQHYAVREGDVWKDPGYTPELITTTIRKQMDTVKKHNPKMPVWGIAQAFGESPNNPNKFIFPTDLQFREMAKRYKDAGVDGLLWWAYQFDRPDEPQQYFKNNPWSLDTIREISREIWNANPR